MDFVTREGVNFRTNDERFTFTGVNNCCIANGYTSTTRTADVLSAVSKLDSDVLRFKMGGVGDSSDCEGDVDGCTLRYQSSPGEFNETAFRHLDSIIAAAKAHGVRVIVPFVDNWGPSGIQQYVDWSDTAEAHDEFYTDERAQSLYRDFIKQVVTRTNTITGQEYRNDPTILMWELANEPRITEDHSPLVSWANATASFLKELDQNHLVSTGGGFYDLDLFTAIHNIDDIDACSMHLWPQNWGVSDDIASYSQKYLADRAQQAMEVIKKPIYLGEYGWWINTQSQKVAEQIDRRNELFSKWHNRVIEENIDGGLAWELLSTERYEYHRTEDNEGRTTGFHYPTHEQTFSKIRSFAQRMDETASST
ncbi:cellulase family glycosylhydrolase [Halorubrum ezzemoulense]|nr:cellulase family glycosylhydrolase [Halorubrum ezzemoulense]